jgi:hypothetical protein
MTFPPLPRRRSLKKMGPLDEHRTKRASMRKRGEARPKTARLKKISKPRLRGSRRTAIGSFFEEGKRSWAGLSSKGRTDWVFIEMNILKRDFNVFFSLTVEKKSAIESYPVYWGI